MKKWNIWLLNDRNYNVQRMIDSAEMNSFAHYAFLEGFLDFCMNQGFFDFGFDACLEGYCEWLKNDSLQLDVRDLYFINDEQALELDMEFVLNSKSLMAAVMAVFVSESYSKPVINAAFNDLAYDRSNCLFVEFLDKMVSGFDELRYYVDSDGFLLLNRYGSHFYYKGYSFDYSLSNFSLNDLVPYDSNYYNDNLSMAIDSITNNSYQCLSFRDLLRRLFYFGFWMDCYHLELMYHLFPEDKNWYQQSYNLGMKLNKLGVNEQVFNVYYDWDVDSLLKRFSKDPLVSSNPYSLSKMADFNLSRTEIGYLGYAMVCDLDVIHSIKSDFRLFAKFFVTYHDIEINDVVLCRHYLDFVFDKVFTNYHDYEDFVVVQETYLETILLNLRAYLYRLYRNNGLDEMIALTKVDSYLASLNSLLFDSLLLDIDSEIQFIMRDLND